MILYHGSNVGEIKILEPRQADHDKPYVYLSAIEAVAAIYMCNAVERPYYWFPYGFEQGNTDVPVYYELYPDALREVSQGVHGYLYLAEADETQVISLKNIPCARLAVKPIPVLRCTEVSNVYELLQRYINEGKLKVRRYEDTSQDKLEKWYDMILGDIREMQLYKTPDCSYAEFIKKKFPFVWDKYMREL